MEITQLKTLIHVAELGNMTKAADRLGVAQPALSRQIRLLERELGTVLFHRHGRGMVLTDPGREIVARAANILAEVDAIRATGCETGTPFQGAVTIGATPTVSAITTVPLVRRIRQAHPDLAIRLASAFTGHLLDWVHRGELEMAISYNPQSQRSLRTEPVLIEDLLLVRAGKQLDSRRPVSFSQLASERMILPSPRHGLRAIIDGCAQAAGITFDASLEADSFEVMIDLVTNGFGSTVLPLAPIYDRVVAGTLSTAPIVEPSPTRKLVLVFPAERPTAPAVRFVARAFLDITRDLVEQGIWSGKFLA